MKKILVTIISFAISYVLYGQTNVVYQTHVDPDSRQINTSLPVGSTAGNAGVSSSGAATYTIPVFTSPGTAGMQPNISIEYNSFGNNSLLGIGWNISGLSAIGRVSQTFYNDGQTKGVELANTDKFALDRNRLIITNGGTYGADGSQYHTEMENFSRITSYGTSGSGPRWFKVETKDGLVIEFGNSANSFLQAKNKDEIIFWQISKITDQNGNYMLFTYHSDRTKGEFWPEKIDYTGNSVTGLVPYNSIKFNYYMKTSDIKTYYVAGSPVINNVLLKSIQALNGANIVREYEFRYELDVQSRLNEVVEYGTDRKVYNSNVFSYYNYTNSIGTFTNSNVPYYPGMTGADFNGDGKDEVMENGYLYTLKSDETGFDLTTPAAVPPGPNQTGDINGDGKIDVIAPIYNSPSAFTYYRSNGNTFTTVGNYGAGSTSTPDIFVHDFNGDGLTDVFSHNPVNGAMNVYWGDSSSPFSTSNIVTIDWGADQYCGDFDGNKKMDIMTVGISGYKIYEWETSGFVLKTSGSIPTLDYQVYIGDFNGDGNSDFICGIYDDIIHVLSNVKSNISTGNGFIVSNFGSNIKAFKIVAPIDIDNDRASEILLYTSSHGIATSYYKFNNSVYTLKSLNGYISGPITAISDFNGDGIMDYLYQPSNPEDNTVLYFRNKGDTKDLLAAAGNGLNNTVHFTYKPITDATVHTYSTSTAYPLLPYLEPLYVVSSLKGENGIGGESQVNYTYQGATKHILGHGFIGFSKVTSENTTTHSKSIDYTPVNLAYYFPQTLKSEQYVNNNLVQEKNFTTYVKDFGNKRIFPNINQTIANVYDLNTQALYNSVTSNQTYDDDGNVVVASIKYGSLAQTTSEYIYGSYGSYCNNRATKATITKTRQGQANYVSVTDYTYNALGNLTRKTEETGNPKQRVTDYVYNNFGNNTSINVSPDGNTGRTTTMEYDATGCFLTKESNTAGHYVQLSYDAGLGKVTTRTDQNNLSASYTYDGFGRLSSTTGPDLNTSTVSLSWVTGTTPQYSLYYSTTQTPGNPDVLEYFDKLGRSIQSQRASLDGTLVYSDTRYDTKGHADYVTLPYFAGTVTPDRSTTTYDDLGRPLTQIAPGVSKSFSYSGLSTTITDNVAVQTATHTADASGALSTATDNGGSIIYSYYGSGLVSQIVTPAKTISMTYDQFGRQTQLADPDAGTYNYTYNNYGELATQTDPQNRTTNLFYDALGRATSQTGGTFNITNTYKTNGWVDNIASSNNVTYTYAYDNLGHTSSKTENIAGVNFITYYAYDAYGRISQVTYPSGFKVDYVYQNGYLKEIKRNDSGKTIWSLSSVNSREQLTAAAFGNTLTTARGYDTRGLIQTMQTGSGNNIQNLEYHFNTKNLMDYRKDNRRSLIENFGYDNTLNRLNSTQIGAASVNTIAYAATGNIQSKYDAGTYTYSSTLPGVVTQVTNPSLLISSTQQTINYNTFNKVASITEGTSNATFTYGPDYSRKLVNTNAGGINTTKYYCDGYEKENKGGVVRELNYLMANGELVAIFEKKKSGDAMHYVHTDHLGSLNVITNESGTIEQELSFDAWGNRRDPATLQNYTTAPTGLITDRGFTGHEHMEEFKLINMNGRIYDPLLGRFLSADKVVANAASTQDYNRFSYCINNPLSYTDPTGWSFAYGHRIWYPWENSGDSTFPDENGGGSGNGVGLGEYYAMLARFGLSYNAAQSWYNAGVNVNVGPLTSGNMSKLGLDVLFKSYVNNSFNNTGAATGIGFTSEVTNRMYILFEIGGKTSFAFSSANTSFSTLHGAQNGEGGSILTLIGLGFKTAELPAEGAERLLRSFQSSNNGVRNAAIVNNLPASKINSIIKSTSTLSTAVKWTGRGFVLAGALVDGYEGAEAIIDGDYNQAMMSGLNLGVGLGTAAIGGPLGVGLYMGYRLIMTPPPGDPLNCITPLCVPDKTRFVHP